VPSLREALQTYTAVIVTGGSSGIGKSFIQLVGNLKPDLRVCNLSRRAPDENFSSLLGKNLNHFPCDLTHPADVARASGDVRAMLAAAPAGKVLLVNNSGGGSFGDFASLPLDAELGLVDLNIRGLVQLTGLLLPDLRARGGGIINVASTLAYVPAPYAATYAATKAFVLHWSLALRTELRAGGLTVLALCPGTTATAFFARAGAKGEPAGSRLTLTPDRVAAVALRAFFAGRAQVVPGFWNSVYATLVARLPKALGARLAAGVMARRRPGASAT